MGKDHKKDKKHKKHKDRRDRSRSRERSRERSRDRDRSRERSKKRRRERSASPTSSSGSEGDEQRKRQKAEKMVRGRGNGARARAWRVWHARTLPPPLHDTSPPLPHAWHPALNATPPPPTYHPPPTSQQAKKVAQYWEKASGKGAAPSKFVWVKKVERDLETGRRSARDFTVRAEAERHAERMSEIEKVQRRREEKEAERERVEAELALLERQRLAAEAADQEEKEEEFHLEQALVRSDRRLAQGRARPIDFVAKALYGLKGRRGGGADGGGDFIREDGDGDDDEEDGDMGACARGGLGWDQQGGGLDAMACCVSSPRPRPSCLDRPPFPCRTSPRKPTQNAHATTTTPAALAAEPYRVFDGLLPEDLEELRDDVRGFKELDAKEPLHADFWRCMLLLADEALAHARARAGDRRALARAGGGLAGAGRVAAAGGGGGGEGGAAPPGSRAAAMHPDVQREIEALLAGQPHGELRRMEADIGASLAAGEGDPDYWEAVLERLQVHAARARLREVRGEVLRRRAEKAEARLDVAEVMGWAAEAADDGGEAAAAARRAAADAALEAAEARAAAAAAAAEAGGEPMEPEEDEEAVAAAAAAAAGAAEEGEEAAAVAAAAAPAAPPARAVRATDNAEEIVLSDDEEEAAAGAGAAAAATAAAAGAPPPGEEMDVDRAEAEQGRLAAAAAAAAGGQDEETDESDGEGAEPGAPRRQQPPQRFAGIGAQGSTRDTRGPEALAESDGRFSPPPVDPRALGAAAAADVVSAEDDARALAALRQEVKAREAARYLAASEEAARQVAAEAADRAYKRQFASRSLQPANPALRAIAAAAAPAAGARPVAAPLRIGMGPVAREEEDPELVRLRALAEKAMAGAAADEDEALAAAGGAGAGDQRGQDMPFGGEVGLGVASQAYWWHSKYAPRKPKYFNRVHTGYEWNKYNRTHYDFDNPPPKVVQGYKFNIFYPDLIDKKATPSYRVEPDPSGSKDTCILVFTAGPPYEDVAFRIVNKEWETTHRRGFRCTFERGILHLYFNFKRAWYRR